MGYTLLNNILTMTTKFIGTKQLRQNMSKITKEAQKNNDRIIVLRKNQPIFELRPLSDEDVLFESFQKDINEALTDKKLGKISSQKQVEKILGL